MGKGGAQLFTELIEEFYNRAYQDGLNASQLLPEGSFAYRQGYENGRRDAIMEFQSMSDQE